MMNIFSKNTKVEFVPMETNLHSWRFIGEEMEALGVRLDATRESLARANSDWARWYWTETLDRLMLQWRSLPVLHDGEVKMTQIPRWTVSYDFYENSQEPVTYGISDHLYDKIFRSNLDESWNKIRNQRIMKCNCQ